MRTYELTATDERGWWVFWPPLVVTTRAGAREAALRCWRAVFGDGIRQTGRGRLLWHGLGMAEVRDGRRRSLMLERIDWDPAAYLPASVSARRRYENRGPKGLLVGGCAAESAGTAVVEGKSVSR